MNKIDVLNVIIKICEIIILPIIAIIAPYLVKFLQAKKTEINNNMENEFSKKYIDLLTNTICDCVLATNQTYVNILKEEGKFDTDAQKTAFDMTYTAVMQILSADAKNYLTNIYGDLSIFISQKIEAAVLENKKTAEV